MIIKSYEIQNNLTNFLKYKLFLLYGENNGLRKDIKELIRKAVDQKGTTTELLSLYENDIIDNKENFYNSIYSGSLFSNNKIITINNGTDKIIQQIENNGYTYLSKGNVYFNVSKYKKDYIITFLKKKS